MAVSHPHISSAYLLSAATTLLTSGCLVVCSAPVVSIALRCGNSPQVVFSGALSSAAEHFAGLGYSPSSPSVNIADYMLDTVIQAPPEEVTRMVIEFKGCALCYTLLCCISVASCSASVWACMTSDPAVGAV